MTILMMTRTNDDECKCNITKV